MNNNKYHLLEVVYLEGKSYYSSVYTSPSISGVATKKIQLQALDIEKNAVRDYLIVKEIEYGIGEKP